jgi:propionyl-CoA carboxylase alpha chain
VIRTLLVANRGEIARRIFRTARSLGLRTVAVYTPPDALAPHVAEADVGLAVPSYLDGAALVAAAQRAAADAIHPGYGFVSENATFAAAVLASGLTWVGPRPENIRAMGDKVEAKRLMAGAGVPVLEGSASDEAASIGYPLVVKAAAGGGGKGMRLVSSPAELLGAVEAAAREAASAFGDGSVFLERWLPAPRHVEIQVFGDRSGAVFGLGERECSVQRRHQKVIEEAPSTGISSHLRERMVRAAVDGAAAIGYVGAGTMEFLVEGEDFWFLEMNTRLQVEHPVTECVTGLDLVRLQLLVAGGEELNLGSVTMNGHAVEARIYAEDPAAGYLPSPGTLWRWRPGSTQGVRYDSGVEDGTVVPPDYDPLLAKVIVHAPTRAEASARLARALRELAVHGVRTNRDQLVALLEDPDWLAGTTRTDFLDRHPALCTAGLPTEVADVHAASAALAAAAERRSSAKVLGFAPAGWRGLRRGLTRVRLVPRTGGDPVEIAYGVGPDDGLDVMVGERLLTGRVLSVGADTVDVEWDGVRHRVAVSRVGDRVWVNSPEGQSEWQEAPRFVDRAAQATGRGPTAPVPGTVVAVSVRAGDRVSAGQVLLVLEAMKMEHRILAHDEASVAEVLVAAGDRVDAGQVLVILG